MGRGQEIYNNNFLIAKKIRQPGIRAKYWWAAGQFFAGAKRISNNGILFFNTG